MIHKSLSAELSAKINSKIKKGWGVGRMFTYVRKLELCSGMTNLGIYRHILCQFKELDKMPSKEKIKYHFRTKVLKEDWDGSSKGEILRDLYDPR